MVLLDGPTPGLDRFDAFRYRRQLRRLERRLRPMDRLLSIIGGRDARGPGVLALTPEQILWVPRRPRRMRRFPLTALEGLRVVTDGHQSTVTVDAPGLRLAVARADAQAGTRFVDAGKMAAYDVGNPAVKRKSVDPEPARAPTPAQARIPSPEKAQERLERLDRMLERGAMTYPEYLTAKQALLDYREAPPDPPRGSWWRRW